MFTNSIQNFIVKSKLKILVNVWLFCAFMLSFHFTAYLLDYMVKAVPESTIDSWNDLAQTNLMVYMRNDYSITQEILQNHNTSSFLARTLYPRIVNYTLFYHVENNLRNQLRKGTHVYVSDRNVVKLYRLSFKNKEPKLFDRLHISHENWNSEPYFIFVKKLNNYLLINQLNKMYVFFI